MRRACGGCRVSGPAALGGQRQDHLAAVGGVVGARDEAALDEGGDGAGHARRATPARCRPARSVVRGASSSRQSTENWCGATLAVGLEAHPARDAHAGQAEVVGERDELGGLARACRRIGVLWQCKGGVLGSAVPGQILSTNSLPLLTIPNPGHAGRATYPQARDA